MNLPGKRTKFFPTGHFEANIRRIFRTTTPRICLSSRRQSFLLSFFPPRNSQQVLVFCRRFRTQQPGWRPAPRHQHRASTAGILCMWLSREGLSPGRLQHSAAPRSFPRLQEQSSHQSIFGLCPWIIYDLFFTSDDHRSKLSISCSLAWSKGSPSPPFEITPFAIKSDCLKEV